jgi:hypothetical protein
MTTLNKGLSVPDAVFANVNSIVEMCLNSMYGPGAYPYILNHLEIDSSNNATKIGFVAVNDADIGQSAIQGMLNLQANATGDNYGTEPDLLNVLDASLTGSPVSYCDPVFYG